MDSKKIIKYMGDAIPKGEHPKPHSEWIQVRLDVVQHAIDHIEWIEKGNDEWKQMYTATNRQRNAAQATARIAISHLQAVLNPTATPAAAEAARDWLISIGSEPG